MLHNYYIYIHFNKNTGEPFYIGKGKDNRASSTYGRNKWWNNIVNKYGFEYEILEDNLSEKYSFELEKYYISLFKQWGFKLCNLTNGGEGFTKNHTEESKKKISENNAKNRKGILLTQEHKDILSKRNKGNTYAKDHKKTKEGLERIKQSNIGNTKRKNKKHSEETKFKISESRKDKNTKKVYQFDLDNNFICEYNSIKEAALLNGYNQESIGRVLRGVRNKYKNNFWKFNK